MAIGYGSLLWCTVGITSAGAKALHLHNNNINNNNIMTFVSTLHKHHRHHRWLYYAREKRSTHMPSEKRVNASVFELQQILSIQCFCFLPVQLNPSPTNPCLQWQLYDPLMLMQIAYLPHRLVCPFSHSLTSVKGLIVVN